MTHKHPTVQAGGITLIVFGSIILTIEIALHVMAALEQRSYHIHMTMVLIAFVIGFVGMYILSPPRAKEGGQFIVDNAIKIIQTMRAGRRKGDPLAALVEDLDGNTATVIIPAPTETEVPIQPTADTPARRKSDMHANVTVAPPKNTGGTGD